jgi:hypothetical protein
MTSINPKNVNMNNLQQNKVDIAPNPVNSLFQRNNYINEGINSNLNYNQNLNINQMQQNKMYKNLNPELGGDMMKDMNMNNLNYNTQNNSINLNLGLQNKKNYSTPILNELPNTQNIQNQEKQDYNKSMDMYERNMQNNKNILNMNQPQNQGNNELYMAEIDRLKQEINDLKKNNEILGAQLKEEQRKNEQLFSIQKAKDENENSILAEIAHCLQVASFDEILPKLNEIINYLNNNVNSNNAKNRNQDGNNKIRDELISKLQNLYLSLTDSDEKKEEVTIKILWRWIKHLVNTVKQLALEKEKNMELYQNIQEIDECKEFCEELMSGLNLQSLDELKMLINNLLNQNNNMNNNQPQMRNAPIKQNIPRQQFQPKGPVQNYQQEEENEEIEGDEQEQEQEGIEEGDENDAENENDNMDPNQQQYENENDYEEEQMQMNEQNNQNDDNYQ